MILTMIDYGIAPNYILTEKPTETMRYTRSSVYFTTQFDVFKDDIKTNYDVLNEVYLEVGQARMVERTMLALGVAEITYDNGKTVIVNYTHDDITIGEMTVMARSAEVFE